MSYASTSIPRPKNWQDFEAAARVLFASILDDVNVSTHGRPGQRQHGVDVYGRRKGSDGQWVGVQCKLKGDGEEVKEAELSEEVEKAKGFEPALSEYILITTAQDDAKLQRTARLLTESHKSSGLFSVDVWGWQTLEREIARYPGAIQAFHPDLTPFTRQQIELSEQNLQLSQQTYEEVRELKELLAKQVSIAIPAPGVSEYSTTDESSTALEILEKHLHAEVDTYRDMVRDGRARTAYTLLEGLRQRVWDSATARVRFRITTNMGAALLQLGQDSDAAEMFLEAKQFDPLDQVGLANTALAYLLKSEPEKAIAAATEALGVNPDNAAAAAYIISGHLRDPAEHDPFSLVPEHLAHAPEVLASAINYLRHHGNESWREAAINAAENYPDDRQLARLSAEATLDYVLTLERFELGGNLPSNTSVKDVEDAIGVLRSQWDQMQTWESWHHEVALPLNLARALWAVDQSAAAAQVLNQAILRTPQATELKELRAALHFEADEAEKAVALFPQGFIHPGLALMRARSLLKSDPESARTILHDPLFNDAPPPQKLAASLLIAETYAEQKNQVEAFRVLGQTSKDHDWSLQPDINIARFRRRFGDDSEADVGLTAVSEKLIPNTRFVERFQLAEALSEAERYDDAVTVLEGYVTDTHDSPALRLYIEALIGSDQRHAALAFLNRLPEDLRNSPYYLKALVAVHINRQEFDKAIEVLERYLGQSPQDVAMRLRWASLCLRQGQMDAVNEFFSGNVEALDGSAQSKMEIAHWLHHLGHPERALVLAYQVFMENQSVPRIHLMYVGLLLQPMQSRGVSLEVDTVGDDAAFQIDDGEGGRAWFVIERNPDLRRDETYLAADNDLATKARGLKVGETITWPQKKPWTLRVIKHKYLYALHRAMDNFGRHFPMEHGLRQVRVDLEAEQPLREMLDEVRQRHDEIQRIISIFLGETAPLHIAASALGADIIDTRYVIQDCGEKFKVCDGTAPEREDAMASITLNGRKGCIVDALALMTIRRLNLESAVQDVCGPILVTGSTRDTFWRRVSQMDLDEQSAGTIFYRNGQYYRQELTDEQKRHARSIREADLSWIDDNASVVPAAGLTDPPEVLRQLGRAIGNDFLDDMLAAQGKDAILISQDPVYRAAAKQYLHVSSTWLQPVLMVAKDGGSLSRPDYDRAVLSMIDFGDAGVSIDSELLLAAMRGDHNVCDFQSTVSLLGGPNAEMLSHIGVAISFLHELWSKRSARLDTLWHTGRILERLLSGRDWRAPIAILRRLYRAKYGADRNLDRYIVEWLQGHFLVPFGTTSLPLADFIQD